MSIGGFYRNALGWSLLCIGNAFSWSCLRSISV
jgi:hypothetical protein